VTEATKNNQPTWPNSSLKRFGKLLGGSGFPVNEQGFSETEMEIPFFKVKDLAGPLTLTETNNYISKETATRLGATIFPESAIVFAKVGAALLLNRFRVLGCEGCLDNNMMALLLKKPHNVSFFLHLLNNSDLSSNFNQGPVPSVNTRQVGALVVTVPPPPDQERITAYLDASCAAIDAAVFAKRRQLETLDALRKTTIHAAVTRGLNSDAKMKPAGVDWLSEAPAHWTPSRIKNVAKLSPGYSGRPPANDEICTVVPMDLLAEAGTLDTTSLQTFEDVSGGLTLFEAGDVLFAKITPCMENGKGAYIESLPTRYAFGSTEFHVLRPTNAIEGKFLYYYTYNPIFRAYAAENMSGAAGQKRVGSRFLKETRLFLPPLPEQFEIIAFLTAKNTEFRTLFAQIESQVATLTAYRKSLIHECVTGQRRITEADVVRSQLSEKTGHLNREPSEKIGRFKTTGGDDRTCSANFGKALKGGGQVDPLLALKSATRRGN